MSFMKKIGSYGVSASLAKAEGTLDAHMYMGGNYEKNLLITKKWHMAIHHFNRFDIDSDAKFHRLTYITSDNDCSMWKWGEENPATATYISHMHYQELNSRHWLFGATTTNNWALN